MTRVTEQGRVAGPPADSRARTGRPRRGDGRPRTGRTDPGRHHTRAPRPALRKIRRTVHSSHPYAHSAHGARHSPPPAPLAALRSDRIGRREPIIGGAAFGVVWGAVPFPLLDTRDYALIAVTLSGALLCTGIIHGPAGTHMPEPFSTSVRYSGAGFSCNLGGAEAPLVVTASAENHSPSVGSRLMSAMALLSPVCILALPETRDRDPEKVRPARSVCAPESPGNTRALVRAHGTYARLASEPYAPAPHGHAILQVSTRAVTC